MGEKEKQAFQLTFNGFLKVDFQGSRVTSDGGQILVRELDERLGLGRLIDEHRNDSRQGSNKRFTFADLLRQSVYSHLMGYENLKEAERVSADQARAVLLAAAGRGVSEPQAVRRHAASDLGAACAGWLGPSRSGRKSGR